MQLALASDHAGLSLKMRLAEHLQASTHQLLDLGVFEDKPADYPDIAGLVSQAIRAGKAERGVLVCGSGIGVCIAANKYRGIRAGMCHDSYSARQGVEHDAMNVLCLGARVIGPALAAELLDIFLASQFSGEDRHRRRLAKIESIERRNMREGGGS